MARGKGGAGEYRDEEPRRRSAGDYERSYRRTHYEDTRDDYNNYNDDNDEYERERYRRSRARKRPARKKRTWPALLLGCFGGILLVVIAAAIVVFVSLSRLTGSPVSLPGTGSGNSPGIGGPQSFSKTEDISPPPSLTAIGQLQVQNQIGNITVTSDANATAIKVTAFKTAKVATSGDAQAEFSKMQAQAQVSQGGGGINILTITGSVPVNNSAGLGNTHNDAINLTITLPATVLSNGSAAPIVNIATSVGNVQMSGLNGVITIKDDIGSVTVQQAQLFDGSHLQTGTGDVTFNGSIDTTTNPQANYKFQAEVGNLNVTLPAATNVTLDANTNAGTIASDFSIAVQSSSGGANYYGPLISGASSSSPAPTVTLVLDVGSGNITLHKK